MSDTDTELPVYSERYARGQAILASMGNDPDGLRNHALRDPVVGPEVDRMLGEFCFGDVWARDGLDLRTRRIITLTSVATLSRPNYIEAHVRGALEQGFTRREIMEIFLHMVAYVGFPTTLSAMDVAGKVFAEVDAAAAQEADAP